MPESSSVIQDTNQDVLWEGISWKSDDARARSEESKLNQQWRGITNLRRVELDGVGVPNIRMAKA
jgi:hypothetical protein